MKIIIFIYILYAALTNMIHLSITYPNTYILSICMYTALLLSMQKISKKGGGRFCHNKGWSLKLLY